MTLFCAQKFFICLFTIYINHAVASHKFLEHILEQPSLNNSQSIESKTQKIDAENNRLCELANCFYDEEEYEEAFILYSKAAQEQHILSQFHLGNIYFNGLGVEKNIDKAIEWHTRAADQNYNESQYALGYIYEDINNHELSVKWYKIAAENGHLDAQYEMRKQQ